MKQQVVTAEQIKKITKGNTNPRHTFLVQYNAACAALTACTEILDAKDVADKADALAALAKIYGDGGGVRQAKILKLRAYRRMGDFARELAQQRRGTDVTPRGAGPILRNVGLSKTEAKGAAALSRLPPERMTELESRKIVPSVATVHVQAYTDYSKAAIALHTLGKLASMLRGVSVRELKDYATQRANRGINLELPQLAEEVRDYLGRLLGID